MKNVVDKIRVLLSVKDKVQMTLIVILMMIGAVLEIAAVTMLMPVAAVFTNPDILEKNRFLHYFYQRFAEGDRMQFIMLMCGIVILFFLLKNLYTLFLIVLQTRFIYRKSTDFATRLFANYLRTDYLFHLRHNSAELVNKQTLNAQMTNFVMLPFMLVLSECFVVVFIGGLLMLLEPKVTVIAGLCAAVILLAIYYPLKKFNYQKGRELLFAGENLIKTFIQSINGIKEIKVENCESYFQARHRHFQVMHNNVSGTLYTAGQLPRLAIESAVILLSMGTLLVFVGNGMGSTEIIMTLTLFVVAMYRLLPSISRIHYNLTLIRQYSPIMESIFKDITQIKPEAKPENGDLPFAAAITVENLSFRYQDDGPWVLKNFSMEIKHLSSTAITGHTGCGKSTLIDILLGLLYPQAGAIKCDGKDIGQNLKAWQRKIGYVPQKIFLFDDTVARNIALGVPDAEIDQTRIWECLQIAQADQFIRELPLQLNESCGEGGNRFSGGQRQRLAIARALYHRPEVLVLDEATSALDNQTENSFVEALDNLQGKLTIITIAHRLSTIEKCDQIIKM